MPLISVKTAIQQILSDFSTTNQELEDITKINGRILAQDIFARFDIPDFDNATMDGFIVRAEDTFHASIETPIRLRVIGDIRAGVHPSLAIQHNQSARIVTGAMIPAGGDAVIPVEDTNIGRLTPGSDVPKEILISHKISPGENIRTRGQFIQKNKLLLQRGQRLKPQHIGIIASQGLSKVEVFRKPRVGLFSTGDELMKVGEPYVSGKIYDSNSLMIDALIENHTSVCVYQGTKSDKPDAIKMVLDEIINQGVDLIISSAGVSMGAHDYVRYVIEQHGHIKLWRVNMRPGKPLVYGVYRDIPFIGLPGNPVSAYIGFVIFVRPVLNKLMGIDNPDIFTTKIQMAESLTSDGRESYLRAKVEKRNGELYGVLTGDQGSGNLFSLVEANALIRVPQGVMVLPENSFVDTCFLDDIM